MSLALLIGSSTGLVLRDIATSTILWSTTEVHVTRPEGLLVLPWGIVAVEGHSSYLYILGYHNRHVIHKCGIAGTATCLTAYGPWIVAGTEDGSVMVWHAPSGRLVNNLKMLYGGITAIAVGVCGESQYAILGTTDGCIVVFALSHLCCIHENGVAPIHVHYVHQGSVNSIEVLRAGTNESSEIRILSVGADRKLSLLRIGGCDEKGERESHITVIKMRPLKGIASKLLTAPRQTHVFVGCYPEIEIVPLCNEVKPSSFKVKTISGTIGNDTAAAAAMIKNNISIDINSAANVLAIGNNNCCQLFSLANVGQTMPLSTYTVEGTITSVKLMHLASVSGVMSCLDISQSLWKGPASGFPPAMSKYIGQNLLSHEDIQDQTAIELLPGAIDVSVRTCSCEQNLGIDLSPFNNNFISGLQILECSDPYTINAPIIDIIHDTIEKNKVDEETKSNQQKNAEIMDTINIDNINEGLRQSQMTDTVNPEEVVVWDSMDIADNKDDKEEAENKELFNKMIDNLLNLYEAL